MISIQGILFPNNQNYVQSAINQMALSYCHFSIRLTVMKDILSNYNLIIFLSNTGSFFWHSPLQKVLQALHMEFSVEKHPILYCAYCYCF